MTTYSGTASQGASTYYTSTALVKTYLGIAGAGDDTLLLSLIARAHAAIDRHCGRVFQASTNTIRYYDPTRDVVGRTLYLDYDCASINTVTNGDSSVIASTSYVTEPRNAAPYWAITLLGTSGVQWTWATNPENAIAISAKWAYSASAPDDIVQAATRYAAWLYKQKDAGVYETTASPELGIITVPMAVPRDVLALLAPYKRMR